MTTSTNTLKCQYDWCDQPATHKTGRTHDVRYVPSKTLCLCTRHAHNRVRPTDTDGSWIEALVPS